ncbi:MAG: hypothetical protein RIR26_351 [Pseudomonadota bacterium]|jgi:hypothetical protein
MHNIRVNVIQLKDLKESYRRYVESYKKLNNGSSQGVRSFFEFYYYINYTNRYSDPRSCVPLGYR